MQKHTVSRRRNFLLLIIFSAVAFSSLSFSTGDAYSFRRFPQKLQVTATDTLPGKERSENSSINDEPVPHDGIESKDIQDALRDIQRSLERLNAELSERNWFGNIRDQYIRAADIYRRGLYLTGGGALLRGLDKRLSQKIKLPVHIADDPLKSVVRGTGLALKNYQRYPFVMR